MPTVISTIRFVRPIRAFNQIGNGGDEGTGTVKFVQPVTQRLCLQGLINTNDEFLPKRANVALVPAHTLYPLGVIVNLNFPPLIGWPFGVLLTHRCTRNRAASSFR